MLRRVDESTTSSKIMPPGVGEFWDKDTTPGGDISEDVFDYPFAFLLEFNFTSTSSNFPFK
jgi:hypothetical protein